MTDRAISHLLVCVLLTTIAFVTDTASASSVNCHDLQLSNDEWVHKRFASSDFIVLAEVTDSRAIPRPDPPATNSVGSMDELLDLIRKGGKEPYFSHEAVLFTDKVWKGNNELRFRVFYSHSHGQHGFVLPVGERFLIFGNRLDDGRYTISTICSGTIPEEDATEKIKTLDLIVSEDVTTQI